MAVQEQEFKVECGCGKKLIFKKRNSKKKVVCGDRGTTIQQVRVFICPDCGREFFEDEWEKI